LPPDRHRRILAEVSEAEQAVERDHLESHGRAVLEEAAVVTPQKGRPAAAGAPQGDGDMGTRSPLEAGGRVPGAGTAPTGGNRRDGQHKSVLLQPGRKRRRVLGAGDEDASWATSMALEGRIEQGLLLRPRV
jgi:hypothetical protein